MAKKTPEQHQIVLLQAAIVRKDRAYDKLVKQAEAMDNKAMEALLLLDGDTPHTGTTTMNRQLLTKLVSKMKAISKIGTKIAGAQ